MYSGRDKNIRLEAFRYQVLKQLSIVSVSQKNTYGVKFNNAIDKLEFLHDKGTAMVKYDNKIIDGSIIAFNDIKYFQRGDSPVALHEQRIFHEGSEIDKFEQYNSIMANQVASYILKFLQNIMKEET